MIVRLIPNSKLSFLSLPYFTVTYLGKYREIDLYYVRSRIGNNHAVKPMGLPFGDQPKT